MKEGFSDILYLLAMVAFFIFSAVMKSRKAKKNLPPQPKVGENDPWEYEQEDALPDFEDVFHTIESNTDIIKEEEKRVEKVFIAEQPARSYESIHEVRRDREKKSTHSNEYDIPDAESFWDEEEFDLKRAIVFSEILKRPEM